MLSMHAGAARRGSGDGGVGAGGEDRRGLPVAGQQDRQVVLVGHLRQAGEHVGQPGLGIVAGAHGVLDHGVEDGAAPAGVLAADESSHPRGVSPLRCSRNRT